MIRYNTIDINDLWNKSEYREFNAEIKIARRDLKPITSRFDKDLIEIIIGPRQSGKTTLLFFLINRLLFEKILPEQIFYLNLDTIVSDSLFNNPSIFVEQLIAKRKSNKRLFLFLDEIQRLENPGLFLKGVFDLQKNIKIFVSGSSSLEIRSKITEFLTGRKRETHLYPLSFTEIVNHENNLPDTFLGTKLTKKTITKWQKNESVFGAYLAQKMIQTATYGGYPAVYLAQNHDERIETLAEIYNSYLRKDIMDLMKIEKIEVFMKLVQTLSSQTGNLVNKAEICSLIGSNAVTITKFINLLKETYIASLLPPYVSAKRNEIKSAHKCFFMDNGLRNFAIKLFSSISDRPDKGAVLENLVFTELFKKITLSESLYFWRTKAGAEMDFVLIKEANPIPIEIKSGPAVSGRYTRSFHAFLNRFSPKTAIFLNKNIFDINCVNQTKVFCIPIHWFLLFGHEMIENI